MNSGYSKSGPVWLEFSRRAMACQFDVMLHPGQPTHGPEVAIEALDIVTFLEQILSVYIPTSDLSRLNHKAFETAVSVSLPAVDMLAAAIEIHRQTEGAFDITAASLSNAWGFSSRQGRMPSEESIRSALEQVGTQHIVLNMEEQTVQFAKPIQVNPGGIGKGYALDQACEILRSRGVEHFAIHGGKSSIRVQGSQMLGDLDAGWKIAVRHPEQTERVLGSLILRDRALGTSGPANQFFYFRGERYGHIIDPRTGRPAKGMLSITVLHPSACWADALATGLYVLGPERAIEYCASHPEVAMLAIVPSAREGQIEVITCNMNEETWIPEIPSSTNEA